MDLADHPIALRWLDQFLEQDRGTATLLLRALRLVSFSEMEESLRLELEELAKSTKGKIALFPITKPTAESSHIAPGDARSEPPKQTRVSKRTRHGSEGRIGHMLKAVEQANHRRFILAPTTHSMRAEKVKHIVLVDDALNTGRRLLDFWKSFADPTVRSWLSSKHCQLWIVVFTANKNSKSRVYASLKQLLPKHIRSCLIQDQKPLIQNELFTTLGEKYGPLGKNGRSLFGFSGSFSNVIFQHGCPNNAPPMLWRMGNGWSPLFPLRSIPSELFPCFTQKSDSRFHSNRLIRARQIGLALAIAQESQKGSLSKEKLLLLVLLGLLARGLQLSKMATQLMISHREAQDLLKEAYGFKLVDERGRLTPFGTDLVQRTRKLSSVRGPKEIKSVAHAIQFYYPGT